MDINDDSERGLLEFPINVVEYYHNRIIVKKLTVKKHVQNYIFSERIDYYKRRVESLVYSLLI